MATQLARQAGAYVIDTGRASGRQIAVDFGAHEFVDLDNDTLEDVGGVNLVFDVIGGDIQKRSAGLVRAGGTLVIVTGPPEARPADGLAIDFVVVSDRAQLGEIARRSGTDACGRTSAPSRPSTTPSSPSTRPSGPRGRRSSAFVHKDSEAATGPSWISVSYVVRAGRLVGNTSADSSGVWCAPTRSLQTPGPFRTRERHASMQYMAPAINQARRRRTLRLAFLSAVVSLVASFAASAAPIPLFNIYRAEDGFTNAGISMAVVTTAVGTIAALLVLGRLSNHLGRRLTAIASLGLLLLGCLLLLNVHDIGTLLAGRLLMGFGTGLASSSLTSYIVDAAPTRPEWLASVASSQGPMLGLTLGAIASGALVQFGPWPRDLIYLVCAGLLVLSAALIVISPETAKPTPGAWRSLLPRVRVPARVRHLLPVAAAVFLATWATGAFYQAFVPALVEDQLHTHSPLILGLVFAAYMAPSVLGAPLGGRFTSAAAQRVGMIIFLTGWIGIITAIAIGTLALFIAATIVAGAGQGIAISGATRGLLHDSTLADRAPIFSAIYLLCYSGAAFPSLISGELSNTFSLPQIALGYGGLAIVATLFTVLAARNPYTDTTRNRQRGELIKVIDRNI